MGLPQVQNRFSELHIFPLVLFGLSMFKGVTTSNENIRIRLLLLTTSSILVTGMYRKLLFKLVESHLAYLA